MLTISCPSCGYSEPVDLHGSYLVKCGRCQQEFAAVIVRRIPPPQVDVVCPQCGYQESLSLGGSGKVQITCSQCNLTFIFPSP